MKTHKLWSIFPALALLAMPFASRAAVNIGVSVTVAPPELPVYEQPPIPDPGYVWTPGYWAWGEEGYYWVPGTWVLAPVGMLWTPGYWGWGSGVYLWHGGYWGPHVGFYGGVNYGYGYGGYGYQGGYWRGRNLYYNRNVNNITNVHITNVYNRTVVNNVTVNRVSYNGGNGGLGARPNAQQLSAARERHINRTQAQVQHQQYARNDRDMLAKVNNGRPATLVTQRPGAFPNRPNSAGMNNKGPADRPGGAGPGNRLPNPGPGPANRLPGASAGQANRLPRAGGASPTNRLPNAGNDRPSGAGAGPSNRLPNGGAGSTNRLPSTEMRNDRPPGAQSGIGRSATGSPNMSRPATGAQERFDRPQNRPQVGGTQQQPQIQGQPRPAQPMARPAQPPQRARPQPQMSRPAPQAAPVARPAAPAQQQRAAPQVREQPRGPGPAAARPTAPARGPERENRDR